MGEREGGRERERGRETAIGSTYAYTCTHKSGPIQCKYIHVHCHMCMSCTYSTYTVHICICVQYDILQGLPSSSGAIFTLKLT